MTAIWSQKKLFPSLLDGEKTSSQIVGAGKKRMCANKSNKIWFTAFSSQKHCFANNWKEKKVVHKSLEQEKNG